MPRRYERTVEAKFREIASLFPPVWIVIVSNVSIHLRKSWHSEELLQLVCEIASELRDIPSDLSCLEVTATRPRFEVDSFEEEEKFVSRMVWA